MKIELNKEQYKTLVEMLFLGNWIANATRTGADDDPILSKYEDFEALIHSLANHDDLGEDFILKADGEYFTSQNFEESLMPLIEEYDQRVFMEQLPIELGNRDWLRELGPVRELTDEHIERRNEWISIYENEMDKNGLKNIIVKNLKD